jgi:hypothetical protein
MMIDEILSHSFLHFPRKSSSKSSPIAIEILSLAIVESTLQAETSPPFAHAGDPSLLEAPISGPK